MHETDQAAVTAVSAGDPHAFRVLVDRHSRYVHRVAYRLTGNHSDAEDVTQEAFLKAYRQLGRFEARADFRTWLHKIAVNCAIDLIRAPETPCGLQPLDDLDRCPRPVEVMQPPAPIARCSAPKSATASLPGSIVSHRSNAPPSCCAISRLPIDEIGSSLGLKTEAAKHSVFRAVKKMRLALEPLVDARQGE
jgi:RNA polymerase sigma-70 factor (ECF subfamily)